ncbi:hypothetical protein CVT25_001194 [Psilocybe cyanescens]|uniref:Uncharacterized protein n=1 Tax=Psilocybe cyanescens TaxID=93625 RepID=A0A409XAX6_PSICY|nr:hypothetical protein CVT25_001194 [Psilocybe cyanescens]
MSIPSLARHKLLGKHIEDERLKSVRKLVDVARQFLWVAAQKSVQIRKFCDPLAKFGQLIVDHCINQRRLKESVFTSLSGFLEQANFFNRILDGLGDEHGFSGTCSDRLHRPYSQRHSQSLEFQWSIEQTYSADVFLSSLGVDILTQMVQLVEPLLNEHEATIRLLTANFPSDDFGSSDDRPSHYSAILTLVSVVGPAFTQFMGAAGISVVAIKYLYGKYQRMYPVDRTIHWNIHWQSHIDSPSNFYAYPPHELIFGAVHIHTMTSAIVPSHFKTKIAGIVREFLRIDT